VSKYVLDSWAFLALFRQEVPAVEVVRDLFRKAEHGDVTLYVSLINAGEVYYTLRKTKSKGPDGRDAWMTWRERLYRMPVTVVAPSEDDVWGAAEFKATYAMSYADGFLAHLAKTKKATVVTGDPEFKALEGVLSILWLVREGKEN
jgi:predicted nucleic acid-binding protein